MYKLINVKKPKILVEQNEKCSTTNIIAVQNDNVQQQKIIVLQKRKKYGWKQNNVYA